MKKIYFLLSMLISSLSAEFNSQTLDVDFTGTCNWNMGLSTSQICAQSFISGLTGTLNKVSADLSVDDYSSFNPVDSNNNPISAMSFTAQIYSGSGCSGTLLASQDFSISFGSSRSMVDITFSSPASVTANQTYTLKITPKPGQTYNDMGMSQNISASWYMTGCGGSPNYIGTPYMNCNVENNDYFFRTYVTTGTLGTLNAKADKEINIYPNPAINTLHITGTSKKENYSINDFSGKQIVSGTVFPNQEINIAKLTPGIYILKLGIKTLKFIKK